MNESDLKNWRLALSPGQPQVARAHADIFIFGLRTLYLTMLNLRHRWSIVISFLSLLGNAADVARAVYVDPALLDACPGYNNTNVKVDGLKLSANLDLAGKPCNCE